MRFVKSTYTSEEEKEIEDMCFDVLGDYVPMGCISVNHGHVLVNECMPEPVKEQMFSDFKQRFENSKYKDLKLAILC